jgi:hypothetical protein
MKVKYYLKNKLVFLHGSSYNYFTLLLQNQLPTIIFKKTKPRF